MISTKTKTEVLWASDWLATVDECHDRLHRGGWSVGETCYWIDAGRVSQVDAMNGVNVNLARDQTLLGAWQMAIERATDMQMPQS